MLDFLKLKIPPVLQVIILSVAIYFTAQKTQSYQLDKNLNLLISISVFVLGSLFAIIGVLNFRSANTTVDPRDPKKSDHLVKSGIYAYTRNPMYVGMFLWLVSVCSYFGSLYSLIYCVLFVLYMTHFQIKPEEEILKDIFGQEYIEYTKQVRRWI
ncbi:methyltransferase family protein [Flavobacterium alkalisoli]|uniref:methyltransferase family protein n=1 Tax=Flavobacterium alkalisoli TaxID=2602769 RepID=UPI003A949AD2